MKRDLPTTAAPSRVAARPRSAWVRWYYVLVALLLVAAGVFLHLRRRADEETLTAHRALSDAERARIEALPRGRPAVLEPQGEGTAEDAWAAWRLALAAIPEDERLQVGRTEEDSDPEVVAAGNKTFAANPGVVGALLLIPHRPSNPPPEPLFRLDPSGRWAPSVDWISDVHNALHWLRVAGDAALEAGDLARALRLSVVVCAIGADLERRDAFLHGLVGIGAETAGFHSLRKALAAGPVPAAEARRVAAALDALDRARRPWTVLFDAEREIHRGLLLLGGEESFGTVEAGTGPPDRHARAAALRRLDEVADRLRDAAATFDVDPLEAAERARTILEDPSGDPLLRTLTTVYPIVIRREAGRRTRREVARVALAVAAYRSEEGRLPERLEDLVPEYLVEIPKDPWDGKPLRWATGVEYGTVWSGGQDRIDQGPDATWESTEEDRGDEVGWRVWGGP